MDVQLREMSEEEFRIFSENSINDYVNDLMGSSAITREEALAEAGRDTHLRLWRKWSGMPGENLNK